MSPRVTLRATCGRPNRLSYRFVFARLVALVPKPQVNLIRYHDVLALKHCWPGLVVPTSFGKRINPTSNSEVRTPAECHAARACPTLSGMTWS
ncbi:MAG: hypothetical protein AAF699_21285 [Pseudomonadota bacterium]